jgi:hypothetical protein
VWTSAAWQPAASWTAGRLGVAAVLLGCLPLVDRLGWVLAVPVAGACLAAVTRDVLLRPTLQADADGVTVVDGVRRVRAGWDEVERLRTVRDRRAPLLELDLGTRVVVLPARRLGAPVDEVLAALEELRQAS